MGMITFNAPCSFVASVALVVVSLPHDEVKLFYSRTKMRRRIKDQPTDGRTDRQTGSQAASQTDSACSVRRTKYKAEADPMASLECP